MRVAVDTNIVGYVEGLDDADRQRRAKAVLARLEPRDIMFPVQAAAELHRLLMRRQRVGPAAATAAVRRWQSKLPIHSPTTAAVMDGALDLAADHGFQIFDAIILAASAEAGCRMLLSEDMHDGFVWRGVTVVNPFAASPHPLLADLLRH